MPITQFIAPGREQAHEVVFEREVEAALAGVALAAGAATELVVDAAALVALGAEHVEAAELAHLVAVGLALGRELLEQLLVASPATPRRVRAARRAAPGAARPSGLPPSRMSTPRPAMLVATVTRAEAAGLGDDVRLPLVLLGVQHLVRDARASRAGGEQLRLLDRDRADEHRLARFVALGDVVGDGVELGRLALVDEVGLVDAHHRAVGGDRHDVEAVGVRELAGLGVGRAGHAGELLVHAEVVLEGDRREGLVLLLDLHPLLRFDGLVQALAPAAAFEDAAGELVDDLHLAVGDDVVDVAA